MTKLKIKSIGTVIPLGDGATGKSLLSHHLQKDPKSADEVLLLAQTIKKSLNIEIEFSSKTFYFEGEAIDTTVQYYVFPGQKQKIVQSNRTFEYIANIFNFLPALKKVSVLLLVYDTTRIESIKSLEYWLSESIKRKWIHSKTKIILVANKIDLQKSSTSFNRNIIKGIHQILLKSNIKIPLSQITSASISALTLNGIENLRTEIFEWVMVNGNKIISEIG
jgi:GTPase SAR1 family protein